MKKLLQKKRMLKLAFFAATVLFSLSFSSLKANPLPTSEPKFPDYSETLTANATGSTAWTLDATIGNVECYYKIVTCDGLTTVLLRFNNKNTNNVKITWKEVFKTQLDNALPGFQGQKELILLPGQTADNDCSSANAITVIRSPQVTPLYPAVVTQFKYSNVSVTNL